MKSTTGGSFLLRRQWRRVTLLGFLVFMGISSTAIAMTIRELEKELGLQPFPPETVAPDFELSALTGGKISLSSLRGQVVFLNFWATWCPPCRLEMPSMQVLHDEYGREGLTILAVDLHEEFDAVQSFVSENELTFPVVIDTNGRVQIVYGVRSIPTTYIVGRNGDVLAGAVGARDWASPAAMEYFALLLAKES